MPRPDTQGMLAFLYSERSPGVPERFHHEIEIVHYPLEGDANFGVRTHSGAKDFLLDGRQTGALFAADDFGIGVADRLVVFPGKGGRCSLGLHYTAS